MLALRLFAPILALTAALMTTAAWGAGSPEASQLDIVGLKLGMTIEQAKSALLAYRPDLIVMPTYITDAAGVSVDGLRLDQVDGWSKDDGKDHRYKIQVGLVAGRLDKEYNHDGEDLEKILLNFPITKQEAQAFVDERKAIQEFVSHCGGCSPGDAPMFNDEQKTYFRIFRNSSLAKGGVTGEWFRLYFTPTDAGGSLSGIIRQKSYDSDGLPGPEARIKEDIPKLDTITSLVAEKYGPLPKHNIHDQPPTDFNWVYDRDGHSLPPTRPDYTRCMSENKSGNRPAHVRVLMPTESPLAALMADKEPMTAHPFFGYLDSDYALIGSDEANAVIEKDIFREAPEIVGPKSWGPLGFSSTKPPSGYRQCGVHLGVHLVEATDRVSNEVFVTQFTVSLADQNALFFDDTVARMAKAEIEKSIHSAQEGPKEKF